MVFPEKYDVRIDGAETGEEIELPRPIRRLDCTEARSFTVPYSYVDLNGHMNNARYFDLAEDSIPAAAAGERLRLVCAEYSNEDHLREELRLQWSREGDQYYLEGVAEKPCFKMILAYEG